MNERTLGRTGLRVSEVGFGAWAIGGNAHGNSYGPTDDDESRRALRRALDLGCTFFDTADVYGHGHSETLLGEVLADAPDVVVATKVGADFTHGPTRLRFDAPYVREAVRASLRRLRRDALDLLQLHNPDEVMLGDPALYDALDDLRAEGLVRHYGVSVHTVADARAALDVGKPSTIQLPFSVLRSEWVDDVLPACARAGVGVIAREPLGNGFLAGAHAPAEPFPPGDIRAHWPPRARRALAAVSDALAPYAQGRTRAQVALRYVLDHDAVSVAIPGCKTVAQVEENLAAADVPPLAARERAALRALVR